MNCECVQCGKDWNSGYPISILLHEGNPEEFYQFCGYSCLVAWVETKKASV